MSETERHTQITAVPHSTLTSLLTPQTRQFAFARRGRRCEGAEQASGRAGPRRLRYECIATHFKTRKWPTQCRRVSNV